MKPDKKKTPLEQFSATRLKELTSRKQIDADNFAYDETEASVHLYLGNG